MEKHLKYQSGSIRLSYNEIKLISKLKYLASLNMHKYPRTTIKFGNRTFNGLRPNFYAYADRAFQNTLNELALLIAQKMKIKNPFLLPYCDIHSSYDVPWHQDNSTFDRNNSSHQYFFEESSQCFKFYIKFRMSFYDLCTKSQHESISFLDSSIPNISFFDVRATHRTYFNPKFLKISLLPKSLSFKISKLITRFLNLLKLDNSILTANLYFMIASDNKIWREYYSRELLRANNQIQNSNDSILSAKATFKKS